MKCGLFAVLPLCLAACLTVNFERTGAWGYFDPRKDYRTLTPMFLTRSDYSTDPAIVPPAAGRKSGLYPAPASIEEYEANPGKYGYVVRTCPAGTIFTPYKAYDVAGVNSWISSHPSVMRFGRVLSGPCKDEIVDLEDIAMEPERFIAVVESSPPK